MKNFYLFEVNLPIRFLNNLTVGSFPFMNNEIFNPEDYDIVINMSDEFYAGYHSTIAKKCKIKLSFISLSFLS